MDEVVRLLLTKAAQKRGCFPQFRCRRLPLARHLLRKILESSEDSELIDLCLRGVEKSVRIAGGLDVAVSSV